MSDKIDLVVLEASAHRQIRKLASIEHAHELLEFDEGARKRHAEVLLSLVRAVRAARAFDQCRMWPDKTELRIEMSAALAVFTDSAELRDDE